MGFLTRVNVGGVMNNTDYRGVEILTSSQVAAVNNLRPFYQQAAQIHGIPWQMLAAIHYREFTFRKEGPGNGDGPYQIWNSNYPVGHYTDAQFQSATNLGFNSTQATNGEGSPYVMNRYDARRDPTVEPTRSNNTWGQIKTDRGAISYPANNDYGAFVVYKALGGA